MVQLVCMPLLKAIKVVAARQRVKAHKQKRAVAGNTITVASVACLQQQRAVALPSSYTAKIASFKDDRESFVTKVGPRKTIDKIHLQLHSQKDRDVWMAKAKFQAVVGVVQAPFPV